MTPLDPEVRDQKDIMLHPDDVAVVKDHDRVLGYIVQTPTPLYLDLRDYQLDLFGYLRAMRNLLKSAPTSWPVGSAVASLDTILADAGRPIDWDHEMTGLQARLAEVERAQATATEPAAGEKKS